MITAAAIFLLLALSLADSFAWVLTLRRIRRDIEARRERQAWPPGRVVATKAAIEETF